MYVQLAQFITVQLTVYISTAEIVYIHLAGTLSTLSSCIIYISVGTADKRTAGRTYTLTDGTVYTNTSGQRYK